jgi:hypothetical protein
MRVVEIRHRCSQPFYTSRRSILAPCHGNIDLFGPLKGTLDKILDLRRALAQVGPFIGLFSEAMLVRAFRAPDDSCGGTSGIEAGVGSVAFVGIAELSVNLRVGFYLVSVSARLGDRGQWLAMAME